MSKPKERKPTAAEQKIEFAQQWLDGVYALTLGYPGQAELCYNLQQKFKLTRAQIATVTDLTLRQVQTRLKQYRKFAASGDIPSAEYLATGLSTTAVSPYEDLVDEEYEKEEQSSATRDANFIVRHRMFEDAVAEKVAPLIAPIKADLKAVEALWKSARNKSKRQDAEIAVACKSDWHYGLENNLYDEKIAGEVNDRFVKKILRLTDLHRTQCPVRQLYYVLNGDNIQGSSANFPSQRWTVRMTAADQTEGYVATEIKNIETFLIDYDEVIVVCQEGNHGAIYPRKTSLEPDHANFETMAHRALRWAFRDCKRVKFLLPDEWYQVVDIDGYKLLTTHGHHISGAGSMDGIVSSFRKLQDILPYFDAFIVGHFHRSARLTMPQSYGSRKPRTGYMSGTAILGDTHSERFGAAHSNQWWVFFTGGGRVTAEYLVDLYH